MDPKLPPDFVDLLTEFVASEVRYLIDLLKSAGGVDFNAAYGRCVHMASGGIMIPVVEIDDLIAMKRAADRDQDRVDVKRLERRRTEGSKQSRK